MKSLLIGVPVIVLSLILFSFQHDSNLNRHYLNELRVTCEEASVAGATFIDSREYSEGRIVFNKTESLKAIEAIIKESLFLDSYMRPVNVSYWTDQVTYKAYFYDDSNTTYPDFFTDEDTGFTYVVKSPTVIVTINAGKAPYRLSFLKNLGSNMRSAAHVWEGR